MKQEMEAKQGDVPDKFKCKNRGFTVSSRTFLLATSQGFSYLPEDYNARIGGGNSYHIMHRRIILCYNMLNYGLHYDDEIKSSERRRHNRRATPTPLPRLIAQFQRRRPFIQLVLHGRQSRAHTAQRSQPRARLLHHRPAPRAHVPAARGVSIQKGVV